MELLSRLSHAFDSSTADQHDFEDGAGTGGKKQKNKKEYSIQAHLEKAHAKTDPNKFACLFIACFLFPTVIGSICTTYMHRNGLMYPLAREVKIALGWAKVATFDDIENSWHILSSIHRSHQFHYASQRYSVEFGRKIFDMAQDMDAGTVCKFGVDTGHYAVAMASATPGTHLWLFEVGRAEDDEHMLPLEILKLEESFLENHWRDRFHVVRHGSSTQAIKKLRKKTALKCQMVVIGVSALLTDCGAAAAAGVLSSTPVCPKLKSGLLFNRRRSPEGG